MPRVFVTELSGHVRELHAPEGATILELARREDLALEGTCGGQMACATCHIVVAPAWYGALPTPAAEEREMVELALRPRRTSRLGCQVKLNAALDGLAFTIVGE